MYKLLAALAIIAIMSQSAYASSINVVSLLDVQGQSDTTLLINAPDDQITNLFPDGKMNSQILAFWINGVLYDAGLSDGHIISELAKNGVNASDVKTILLTHLHPDHVGGLLDPQGKMSYPNAEVYVSKPEYDYWVNELKAENVINALKGYQVSQFMFGDEVIAGVKAIDTTGHTPGHTSYLIEADGEKLIVAGDIMHFQRIQLPAPEVAVRYDVDPVKAVQSRKFLLDYAAWKNIPVAGMHIEVPGVIQVKKSGEGYETY